MISLREDGSAIIEYTYEDYPVEIKLCALSSYPNYYINSHWHNDIEFIAVHSGCMLCNVNGTMHRLEAGQGIFINSRAFHYIVSPDRQECIFISLVFHPGLFCGSPHLENTYVTPFISPKAPACIILHKDDSWKSDVQRLIEAIYENRNTSSAALLIQSELFMIWRMLYENEFIKLVSPQDERMKEQKLTVLKTMVDFIKDNYQEKISLDDIAKVGCISKSGCLSIFKRYLHESPVDYLIDHRLKIGAKLLSETTLSVTSIAYQVGFSSTSYFSSRFHTKYDCTPQQYRKQTSKSTAV